MQLTHDLRIGKGVALRKEGSASLLHPLYFLTPNHGSSFPLLNRAPPARSQLENHFFTTRLTIRLPHDKRGRLFLKNRRVHVSVRIYARTCPDMIPDLPREVDWEPRETPHASNKCREKALTRPFGIPSGPLRRFVGHPGDGPGPLLVLAGHFARCTRGRHLGVCYSSPSK
jgi:hypothetical protein